MKFGTFVCLFSTVTLCARSVGKTPGIISNVYLLNTGIVTNTRQYWCYETLPFISNWAENRTAAINCWILWLVVYFVFCGPFWPETVCGNIFQFCVFWHFQGVQMDFSGTCCYTFCLGNIWKDWCNLLEEKKKVMMDCVFHHILAILSLQPKCD